MFSKFGKTLENIVDTNKFIGWTAALSFVLMSMVAVSKFTTIFTDIGFKHNVTLVMALAYIVIGGVFCASPFTVKGMKHLSVISYTLFGTAVLTTSNPSASFLISIDPVLWAMVFSGGILISVAFIVDFYIKHYLKEYSKKNENSFRYISLITNPDFNKVQVNKIEQLFELYKKLEESGKISESSLNAINKFIKKERTRFVKFVFDGVGHGVLSTLEYKTIIEQFIKADSYNTEIPEIVITFSSSYDIYFTGE